MARQRWRPQFDERFTFVAKRLLRFTECTYRVGDVIDKSHINPRRLRQLYEGRYIDVYDHNPVAALPSAPLSPEAPDDGGPVAPEPEVGEGINFQPETTEVDTQQATDDFDNGPLPDGWRDLGAVAIRHLAVEKTGVAVRTGSAAIALLEEYERGRAA